ncbi:MAG: protein kinase [Actinomycetota bacterium]|nr:protein kinase [Actinomycetota bacterium]
MSDDTAAMSIDDEPLHAVHDEPLQARSTRAMGPAASGWVLGNRYRVIERIGSGGMAEVFRAHDVLLDRDVALKVFRAFSAQPDTTAGRSRQQTELHALARLNHPNLITLFDGSVGTTDEPAYLVMELIDGPNLATTMGDNQMPEPQIRELGIQMADALSYVHAQGMVHRDVKPANILLGSDSDGGELIMRARLSDFGIVRLIGTDRLTGVDLALGTAAYLAPEQARGDDVGPQADVYSLGLVLLEALTGVRAYGGPALEALAARVLRSPDVPSELPPPWPELLAAMTELSISNRPPAAQVAQALRSTRVPAAVPAAESVAAGVAEAVPLRSRTRRSAPGWQPSAATEAEYGPAPAGRRHGLTYAAAILVAALLGLAATMLFRPVTHAQPSDQRGATTPLSVTSTQVKGGAPPVVPAGIVPARDQQSLAPTPHARAVTTPTQPTAHPVATATAGSALNSGNPMTSAAPNFSSTPTIGSSTAPIGSSTVSGAAATPPAPASRTSPI